jgi:hypothetical protein
MFEIVVKIIINIIGRREKNELNKKKKIFLSLSPFLCVL